MGAFGRFLNWVRILRTPNLLFVALTMYLVRHCLIIPVFEISALFSPGLNPSSLLNLSEPGFFCLVLAVVLIAAAGNLINDYFDVETDRINKPQKWFAGKLIPLKSVFNAYIIFTLSGLLLGGWIALKYQIPIILLILVSASCVLYFYSWKLKKTFLLGNIAIACSLAFVPLTPCLAEPEFYLNISYGAAFSMLAFSVSLMREIAKDAEDLEGDLAIGAKTIPIVMGLRKTGYLISALSLFLALGIGWILYRLFFVNTVMSFGNLATLALIPFVVPVYLGLKAKTKKDFSILSSYLKFLALTGVLSMIPFCYLFLR